MTGLAATTKKITEAHYAYCTKCDQWFDSSGVWSLSKSVALHEAGTGHKKNKEIKLCKLLANFKATDRGTI